MFLVVYTPWCEEALIHGHRRIDHDTVRALAPDHAMVWPTFGWRHPVDQTSDCLIQAFDLREVKRPAVVFPGRPLEPDRQAVRA